MQRSGVRPSVRLFRWRILIVTHKGTARDMASVHFHPSTMRTDICVKSDLRWCITTFSYLLNLIIQIKINSTYVFTWVSFSKEFVKFISLDIDNSLYWNSISEPDTVNLRRRRTFNKDRKQWQALVTRSPTDAILDHCFRSKVTWRNRPSSFRHSPDGALI